METWVYVALLMAAILILKYVLRYVVDRGADEISNAKKRKQNEENPDNTESLANRYRH